MRRSIIGLSSNVAGMEQIFRPVAQNLHRRGSGVKPVMCIAKQAHDHDDISPRRTFRSGFFIVRSRIPLLEGPAVGTPSYSKRSGSSERLKKEPQRRKTRRKSRRSRAARCVDPRHGVFFFRVSPSRTSSASMKPIVSRKLEELFLGMIRYGVEVRCECRSSGPTKGRRVQCGRGGCRLWHKNAYSGVKGTPELNFGSLASPNMPNCCHTDRWSMVAIPMRGFNAVYRTAVLRSCLAGPADQVSPSHRGLP